MKKWVLKDSVKIAKKSSELFDHYPDGIARIFLNRGIKTKDGVEAFLDPQYESGLHDPFLFSDMKKAVERILDAINNKERIVIYGDYDCDGIPGSAILHNLFKKIGFDNFEVYIPHRHDEGFGVNKEAVEELSRRGADLIITVDNGTTDIEAISEAVKLGMEVIITDHHESKEILPPAYAILNPKLIGEKYPFKHLSGAGVAFKLAQAIISQGKFEIKDGWEKWLLDLASIGTISDMVPLVGENRVIAKYGLQVLRRARRPGFFNLFRSLRIDPNAITEEDIGFSIGPRINAASRMGVPFVAFQFVSASDEGEAILAMNYLEEKNKARKSLTDKVFREANNMVKEKKLLEVNVVGSNNWTPAIAGLVAGKLAEEHKTLFFVWGRGGNGTIKGSCRSFGGVSLVDLMTVAKKEFEFEFGGHHLAGGFSLFNDDVGGFEKRLNDVFSLVCGGENKESEEEISLDTEIKIGDIDWKLYNFLEKMAPFGVGNPRPVFLIKNLEILSIRKFGKTGGHLEIGLTDGENKISAYDFYINEDSFDGAKLALGKKIDLAGTIDKNNYGRAPSLRLKIVDIHPVK